VRCFNHNDREAIGLCRTCARGLCRDCATDLPYGLACKGVHETSVTQLHEMTMRASRVQSSATRIRFLAPSFYLVIGAVFLTFGLYHEKPIGGLLTILGASMGLYGIVVLVASNRAYGRNSQKS